MQNYFRDFISIYKSPFHKIVFDKVKLVKIDKSKAGNIYYHFIGKFRFIPCKKIFNNEDVLQNKNEILKGLKSIEDDFGMEFRKKFTKKMTKNGETHKWAFNFIFDFHPKNIVDFNIDCKNEKMEIMVYGYGIFS